MRPFRRRTSPLAWLAPALAAVLLAGAAQPSQLAAQPSPNPLPGWDPQSGFWVPAWTADTTATLYDPQTGDTLTTRWPHFAGATYPTPGPHALPVLQVWLPVAPGTQWVLDGVEGLAEDTLPYPANGPATPPVRLGQQATASGQTWQLLELCPLQPLPNGQTRRWQGLHYQLAAVPQPTQANSQPTNTANKTAANDLLATGTWARVGITQDGIYQVDAGLLEQLGWANVQPNQVRLFAYPGGMLPQANAATRPQGLQELPVLAQGNRLLFWADGPHTVRYQPADERLLHELNLYADTAWVYLAHGLGGPRSLPTSSAVATGTPRTTVRALAVHHQDRSSAIAMGRHWLGERFDLTRTQSFTLPTPSRVAQGPYRLHVQAAARAGIPTTYSVALNGQTAGTLTLNAANLGCSWCPFAALDEATLLLPVAGGPSATVALTFNAPADAQGWLDYIHLEYARAPSVALGGAVEPVYLTGQGTDALPLSIPGLQPTDAVWAITDPLNPTQLPAGSNPVAVPRNAQGLARLAIFRPTGTYPTPTPGGAVPNQDLRGLPAVDYLVITHPNFLQQAQRVANLHSQHNGLSTAVVTTTQVYHSFSAGRPDPTALRDFIRHQYTLQSPPRLQSVLLYGDASYDYRGRRVSPPFVPTYQARESFYLPEAYCTDDYYGFMDETEGFWGEGKPTFDARDTVRQTNFIDLGIGRAPVTDQEQATTFADKVEAYLTNDAAGDWQNRVMLFSDYKEGEPYHMQNNEQIERDRIRPNYPCINIDKLYLDEFPMENTAEGLRFPEAQAELTRKLEQGQLVVNYTGHGGEVGLSNARILEIPDIRGLRNGQRLPFWITATCEFGRFDDPERPSGAELLTLNAEGGAIAMLTSVRQVFANDNQRFNLNVFGELFRYDTAAGRWPTLGEVYRRAKNASFGGGAEINTRNFVLMGDPGLTLAYPRYQAVVTAINQSPLSPTTPDTLRALGQVDIEGEVRTPSGQLADGYTGEVFVQVFDKPVAITTLQAALQFEEESSVLYKGRVQAQNGRFSFRFVVPLDINYQPGAGKISLFALGETGPAMGCTRDVVVCCTDPEADFDNAPPTVDLGMGGPGWQDGGLTGPRPLLYAETWDDQGLNTSGLGVGRDLVAVLDGDDANPFVLNDFFVPALGDPTRGTIAFRLPELPAGEHTLSIRVWDVTNQSATDVTTFRVGADSALRAERLRLYPNPASGQVQLAFDHTADDLDVEATLLVRDLQGRTLLRHTTQLAKPSTPYLGFRLAIDGTGAAASPADAPPALDLPNGLYHVQVQLQAPTLGQATVLNAPLLVNRP